MLSIIFSSHFLQFVIADFTFRLVQCTKLVFNVELLTEIEFLPWVVMANLEPIAVYKI